MYTLIGFPGGIIVEAVVLAKGANHMRVAAAGFSDAFELRRSGDGWVTETGESVEIEFLLASSREGGSVASRPVLVVRAAGAPVS